MRHEIVILSVDLKHDSFAVSEFEKVAVENLRACGVQFEILMEFDDGAGSQYKFANTFEDISKSSSRLSVVVIRVYFGSGHGKDHTAVVKQYVCSNSGCRGNVNTS
jgi:hypothetical protein